MVNSHKTGTFVYFMCIYKFLSVLWSMVQSSLKPSMTPMLHGRSFIYALQRADLHLLHGYMIFSGKARNRAPKYSLFSSWLPGPRFFNIKFPGVPSLPHSSQCQSGSGKDVGKQSKLCDLKSCSVSVCITKDADYSRILTPFFRGERWEWFPGWRLAAASGLIEEWGLCGCWWP